MQQETWKKKNPPALEFSIKLSSGTDPYWAKLNELIVYHSYWHSAKAQFSAMKAVFIAHLDWKFSPAGF